MRIVITGGGTGGHVYPALAVAEALRDRWADVDLMFIGGRGLERQLVPQAGLPFYQVASHPWPRPVSRRTPGALMRLGAGMMQAAARLIRFRPHVVLATGGYAAAPVGTAAGLLGIPLVVQEQNVIPGTTNRLLARWATVISVPHPAASRYFPRPTAVTGVPLRSAALRGDRRRAIERWGLDERRLTMLVLGGSQGASSLNAAVLEMAGLLPEPAAVQVVHQTGPDHQAWVRGQVASLPPALKYVAIAYIEHIADAYACADLVICRAGAGTLAEVTAHGLPAVAVPYPFAVAGEQEANARMLETAGAAVVVPQGGLSGPTLAAVIAPLRDPVRRQTMATASRACGRPRAAAAVAELVVAAAQRRM